MTDKEMQDNFDRMGASLQQVNDRLEKFYREFSAFRQNSETNHLALLTEMRAENKLLNAKLDNLGSRLELLADDHRQFKIQTKARLDELEEVK